MIKVTTLLVILLAIPISAAARSIDDVEESRRALRHAEAIATLRAAIDAGDTSSAARLAELSLEAALVARLGETLPRSARAVVEQLAALELQAFEAVSLARLAFFHGEQTAGEAALGRARDLDPETKAATDRLLAEARGEEAPEGGYFRYRGLWVALARRDRERLFDQALEALWELNPDREAFRLEPSVEVPNLALFRKQWKGAGPSFLRRSATDIRTLLADDYDIVRSWLPSYDTPPARERLLRTVEVMREPREAALKLISTYGKSQQRQVDDNRRKLEELYGVHSSILDRDWRKVDQLDPEDAFKVRERTRAREEALGKVHRYLAAYGGGGLPPAVIAPAKDAATTTVHVLPGREQSGLEDVLWLVLNHAADQHLDVMARCAEIQRNGQVLTPWEELVVGHVRVRSIEAYNQLVATSLNSSERECCRGTSGTSPPSPAIGGPPIGSGSRALRAASERTATPVEEAAAGPSRLGTDHRDTIATSYPAVRRSASAWAPLARCGRWSSAVATSPGVRCTRTCLRPAGRRCSRRSGS